jgi:hypothetical protein
MAPPAGGEAVMRVMQCPSCGAPLDVAPAQRYVACGFCRATVDVGSRTVLPAHAGAPAGPPAPPGAPWPHGPGGPSGGTLRPASKAPLVLLAAVGALVAFGALGGAVLFLAGSDHSSSPPPAVTGVPALPPPPPAVKANYFNDASGIAGQVKAKLGPRVALKRLVVYDEYVIFTAQDPRQPDNLDTYTLRGGAVGEGRPETVTGDRGKLEAELFPLDDVPFGSLATLGRDAVARLQAAGVAGGKLSHIIVEREDFGRGPRVVVRPYASSERRGGGFVEYDARGNLKRVVGP